MKTFFTKLRDWCVENFFEEVTPEEELKRLNFTLDELRSKKNKGLLWMKTIVFFIVILAMTFFYFCLYRGNLWEYSLGWSVICSMFSSAIFFLVGTIIGVLKEREIEKELLRYEIDIIKEQVQEDIFENSIKMSYKYLDQYYSQTKDQAQKGFYTTVCISILGALLIGVGIIMMFLELTEPSYVTCASGVITEFIAAIFFYLYNRTITSMSKYHNKLVLSHNISIALKVADSLPDDDKVKTKDMIISELLKDINSYLIKSDSEDKK